MSKKVINDDECICVKHNAVLKKGNFYQASEASLYAAIGVIPVCKKCISKEFDKLIKKNNGDTRKAVYQMCMLLDVCYTNAGYDGAIKSAKEQSSIFGTYMRYLNSLGSNNGGSELNFASGETLVEDIDKTRNYMALDEDTELTELAKLHKADVINILERDPFEKHSISDQNYLYSALISYLSDEDVKEDAFLVSQIEQIVDNNNMIRKLDISISNLSATQEMAEANYNEIRGLTSLKKDIVFNTDKIADKNKITVGRRDKGGAGTKNSFTKLMKYLRNLNFSDAEVNFYDERTCYGMMRAAKISFAAMKEQFFMDDDEINDMIVEMRERIVKFQYDLLDRDETIRKLVRILIHNKIDYLEEEAKQTIIAEDGSVIDVDSFEDFDSSFLDE